MSIVYAPSTLSLCPDFNTIVAAVGPFIQIFSDSSLIAEHLLFPADKRIAGLIRVPSDFLTYAEALLQLFALSPDFLSFEVTQTHSFKDWILTAKEVSSTLICVVLRHGQFVRLSPSGIDSQDPPIWKIAASAFILDDSRYFLGDLFGTISLIGGSEYLEGHSSFGAIFGIDFNPTSSELLTAHEHRSCVRWRVTEYAIEKTWEVSDHPSRVFGCQFLPHSPVSFGEDGSVHVHDGTNRVLNVHRTKSITAFVVNGNEIMTAGQNGAFRHFAISGEVPIVREFVLSARPLSVAVLRNGRAVVGTGEGSILGLPENQVLFASGSDVGGIYQIVSFQDMFFAASKNRWLFVGRDFDDCHCFKDSADVTAVSLAMNELILAVISSNNTLRIMNYDGTEKAAIPLDAFFAKPPITLGMHPSAPIVAIGGHSSRICVIEFNDDITEHSDTVLSSATNDGFQGICFSGGFLYCAGRSDGTLSIFGPAGDRWVLKSSWQIPAQAKKTVHLQAAPTESALVSSLIGQSVGLWDIATQTMLASFPIEAQRAHVSIHAAPGTFSAAWIDKASKVSVIYRAPCLPSSFIGTHFHGLRGLSGAKISDDTIVTGSCDRDVRVWRITDGKIHCLDEVQANNSGTHAICSTGDLVFTGGSQGALFVWRIDRATGLLYRQLTTVVSDQTVKCKLRITAMAVSPSLRLLVAMSDASLAFYQYFEDEKRIDRISNEKINGVGITSDFTHGTFAVGTSLGECHFFGDITGSSSLHQCGIHCVRLFEEGDALYAASAADDGTVAIWRVNPTGAFPVIAVKKGHVGGVKAIAVGVVGGLCRICSFSYDQAVRVHVLEILAGRVAETRELCASIPDGEVIEFVSGGVVVFGAGIQFIAL
jgi:WD40 repeat protein